MTDVTSSDALISPSFLRNRDPILSVLTRALPERGTVLEIASGSGEHAIYFAAALPSVIWQPTGQDPVALRSIAAHRVTARLPNMRPALQLDASARSWLVEHADAIVAINILHVSPRRAAEGLMAGAGRVLRPGSVLDGCGRRWSVAEGRVRPDAVVVVTPCPDHDLRLPQATRLRK
jgi:SAM-dependent methyltransferase